MPGGTRAILEPWRNTVAQLHAHVGLARFAQEWGDLELARYLAGKPVAALAGMIAKGLNTPLSSSCGRLFDAVAAAVGVCRDRASYEGEAAIELEALVGAELVSGEPAVDRDEGVAPTAGGRDAFARTGTTAATTVGGYPLTVRARRPAETPMDPLSLEGEGQGEGDGRPNSLARSPLPSPRETGQGGRERNVRLVLDPAPLWPALLADLRAGASPGVIAARFHRGLGDAVATLAADLALERGIGTVALSGGVFQNRTLLELVASDLRARGLRVLQHRQVPANDGGLALGQAVVSAVRILMA